MADRGDTHYGVPGLNKWFLFSSFALLATTVWMVYADWDRPWKRHQLEFREIEVARVRAEEQELDQAGATAREAELVAAVEAAQASLAGRRDELAAAEEELRLAKGDLWSAIEAAKKTKSEFNWERYVIEEERRHLGVPDHGKAELDLVELAMNEAMGVQQELEARKAAIEAKVSAFTAEVEASRKALTAGTRDLDQVRKRLAQLDREAMSGPEKIADVIRDAPGLDFVKPSLKVNKVVLSNLTFELNFTKKPRIDMCHTCHLASDRAGFEDEAQPYSSHPRLDLYLSSKSPHPLKDFGCTICHRGSGEALEFVRADHRPGDPTEAAEWHDEHGWHKQHHWDYPMLASDFTEASCVQCHKSSMELIADDAPTVTEGYRLVEEYGCYSCHKIDWFPTKRRPGPTLTNLQSKLTPEFVSSWISDPKAFRPTTRMPRFFHLENYPPDEVIAKSRYGQGREIKGREWDDASIAAISAFLVDRAPREDAAPIPVAGDAHRGREVMRLSGCFSCHNLAPHGEEPVAADPALEASGTNEHGPNLRGVATKVTPEWLYAWIKDPRAYWPETKMPDLRLSDQEAADIVAYMTEDPDGYFRDVPEGWAAKQVEMPADQMREVLAEQARWFFARDGRAAIEERIAGEWQDVEELKVAVGEKLVLQYGCFSCHEIEGLQDAMPIGTELSNWGSKTVDKLDFGFGVHEFGLDPSYREGWLMRKLRAPRSYDQKKVKNPTEKLRMPEFGFDDEQVQAIATFVVGLVDDEVQRAKMLPKADDVALDAGHRAIRQKNCLACHSFDPGTITFVDETGAQRTIAAEIQTMSEDQKVPSAHDLEAVRADAEKYEVDELTFRVLRPEPDVGKDVGEKIFVPVDGLQAMGAPRGGDFVRLVTDYYMYGLELFDPSKPEEEQYAYVSGAEGEDFGVRDVDGTLRDHSAEPYDKVRWTYAPPVLWDEGGKVQRDWFYGFLKDVVPLRHQIRVRMPSFHYDAGEAEAIVDALAWESAQRWPSLFARKLRLAQGKTADELGAECGLSGAAILEIEDGVEVTTRANFPRVLAYAEKIGFTMRPAVHPTHETSELRAQAYLSARADEVPGHLQLGQGLATAAVNCFQCHFRLGTAPNADPIAWAPDLALTHERLREDWVRDWLVDPARIYPGTSMPANFGAETPQYQEHYPGSTNSEQIRVVLEWLYNFDRLAMNAPKGTAQR
jgi:cbb3-type cytochrome oxidase cytochrome c subunit